MRNVFYLLFVLVVSLLLIHAGVNGKVMAGSIQTQLRSSRPRLEYLKAVNRVGPPKDPQLLFLLMAEYANASRQAEGVEFFSARLNEFSARLTDPQRALYLSAIVLLRAQHASAVSWLNRVGYVKETIAMLDQAKKLSDGRIFVVNWVSGVVRAQLPGLFHQKQAALADLSWCEANIAKAPHLGWLREVYFRLGGSRRWQPKQSRGVPPPERLQELRQAGCPHHAILERDGLRLRFCAAPHHRDRSGPRLCALRFRIHRILFRRLRRSPGVDRDRRGDPRRFGKNSLRGAACPRSQSA
jgi:hypothetical protein